MSYFKREEKTASVKQVAKVAETFIGILNSQKKLNIDMSDKATKSDAVIMTVDCIREWETESKVTLTSADVSTFFAMSYRRSDGWHYEEDASVIALVEEKMLQKFSGFKVETLEVSKPKEAKRKEAKKQSVTLRAKEKPVDSKPISVGIKINDEILDLGASMGLSDSDVAKFAHFLAKANS